MVFSHFGHKLRVSNLAISFIKRVWFLYFSLELYRYVVSKKRLFPKIMCWDTDSCNTMVVNRVLKFWSGHKYGGRCGGLMVSALDSRASGPGSSPGRGDCVLLCSWVSHTLLSQCLSPARCINGYRQT